MPIVDYNSPIAESLGYRTRAQLRIDLLIRLGYAGQTSAPPPGMNDLLNSFLDSAHKALCRRPGVPRQERWFTWTMAAGQKFYGLDTNEETPAKRLDQYHVLWVGVQRDDIWVELKHGIPPHLYSETVTGSPERYQIGQSIEVWPTPNADVQYLRVKGYVRPDAFTGDSDAPSIDDELVFLYALSLAKKHYEQADWQDCRQEAELRLGLLVAGGHQTARLIPGSTSDSVYVEPKPTVPF